MLIATAPFVRGRSGPRALANTIVVALIVLFLGWLALAFERRQPAGPRSDTPRRRSADQARLSALALLNLLALVGFGKRFYERREDLDRWLALGATLMLFASLHYIFTPVLATSSVSRGDFLRLLAYGLLLVGAWRAISFAVFGRAVAEERARVAREIHDGLAQYLFAVSTHATMLEHGAPPAGDDREAEGGGRRSAAGSALRHPCALDRRRATRRSTRPCAATSTSSRPTGSSRSTSRSTRACGSHRTSRSRSSASSRKGSPTCASTRTRTRAEVVIGMRDGERFVSVRDDGDGFDGETTAAGQGLKNIRARTQSIAGGFDVDARGRVSARRSK